MIYTTAPQPERASLSMPDKRHCDTVSNSCSGSCSSTGILVYNAATGPHSPLGLYDCTEIF